MKRFTRWLDGLERHWLWYVAATLLPALLLFINLGGLTDGISDRELATQQASRSLQAIANMPAYLPLSLLHWTVSQLPWHNILLLRLPSVAFAIWTLAFVAYILRRWYGPRTALFGFVIFICGSWFLHAARLGTFDIMYVWAVPMILAGHIWLTDRKPNAWILAVWLLVMLGVFYVPGLVWFVLLATIWQLPQLKLFWRKLSKKARISNVAILLVGLSPLTYSLVFHFRLTFLLNQVGLPTFLPSFSMIWHRLADSFLFIAIRGNAPDDLWLNHLPILDAFLACMLIVGIYFYATHWQATRSRLIGAYSLLGFILYWCLGPVNYGVVVPLLYLVAAAGLAFILHQWLIVFPKNPLARGLGIGILSLAVGVSCIYSLRQYFIAWPHHPATKAVFSEHTIPPSHLLQ